MHGVSETGRRIFNKQTKRAKLPAFFETLPRCVLGMEACGYAHHRGRQLRKLGYDLRLGPAACDTPYVTRGEGRHLANSLRTGTFCVYHPEARVEWRFEVPNTL